MVRASHSSRSLGSNESLRFYSTSRFWVFHVSGSRRYEAMMMFHIMFSTSMMALVTGATLLHNLVRAIQPVHMLLLSNRCINLSIVDYRYRSAIFGFCMSFTKFPQPLVINSHSEQFMAILVTQFILNLRSVYEPSRPPSGQDT